MDELNNIQNPNIPSGLPSQGMPGGQMSPMPQASMTKKSRSTFWITILALAAVGAFAWWYIGQMSDEPLVVNQPNINQEARQDTLISGQIQSVDMGDLDAEFKAIDTDLNSL